MSLDYINEAFKKLELLNEETFDTSLNGINQLSDFMDNDDAEDIVRVIDDEATSQEELKDSYIGKVIVNCNVCHSHIFRDKDGIEIDTDGVVNGEEQCPYCGEQEGFTVVGEISEFKPDATAENAEPSDTPDEPSNEEETLGIDESLTENLDKNVIQKATSILNDRMRKRVTEEPDRFGLKRGVIPVVKKIKQHGEEIRIYTNVSQSNYSTLDADEFDSLISGTLDDDALDLQADVLIDETSDKYLESLEKNTSDEDNLSEDFKNVSITTDDQHMEMSSDDNGKVTVTTEPVNTPEDSDEVIVPVSDETQMDIEANNADSIEEPVTEEPVDDTTEEIPVEEDSTENTEDVEFEEVDEQSLDELGEHYLRRVYENVDSYRTTDIHANNTQLIVEGILKFNSGVEKKTGFIFEAKDVNSKGSLRFTGFNKHLTESKDAYTLVGSVKDKKLFVESFKYNYTVGDAPVRGVVRKCR